MNRVQPNWEEQHVLPLRQRRTFLAQSFRADEMSCMASMLDTLNWRVLMCGSVLISFKSAAHEAVMPSGVRRVALKSDKLRTAAESAREVAVDEAEATIALLRERGTGTDRTAGRPCAHTPRATHTGRVSDCLFLAPSSRTMRCRGGLPTTKQPNFSALRCRSSARATTGTATCRRANWSGPS